MEKLPSLTSIKRSNNNVELTSSFLLHNGFTNNHHHLFQPDENNISDNIELISVKSVTYTSLKDLLPASPLSITSPTTNNASWHEIPIKNPLVKQAALAYLQPMSSPPVVGNKGFFGRLKDIVCCNECGCLGWLNSVVFKSFREGFLESRRRSGQIGVFDDYEDDDDEDEDE